MNLAGVVLAADAVLRGSVEVELLQGVGGAADVDGAGGVGLDAVAEVLELCAGGGVVRGEVDGAAAGRGGGAGVDVDGGLVGAAGAGRVGGVQAVPVKGALELVVAELAGGAAGWRGIRGRRGGRGWGDGGGGRCRSCTRPQPGR